VLKSENSSDLPALLPYYRPTHFPLQFRHLSLLLVKIISFSLHRPSSGHHNDGLMMVFYTATCWLYSK